MSATAIKRTKGRLGVRAAVPAVLKPMLSTLISQPFDNPRWIFEPKYDGLRVLARFDGKNLLIVSRNNEPQNLLFPEIADGLRRALKKPCVVDGEVVCLDERGDSQFHLIQQRFHLKSALEIQSRMRRFPAHLYVFDLLYLDGYDLTGAPLIERKAVLRKALRWSDRVRWTEFEPEHGVKLWRQACRSGGEGIMGKLKESRYTPGYRSHSWVKIKCLSRQEFVIGGFTDPQGSRIGLGALLLGYYSDDGKQFHYAGKVGTGYSHEVLSDLRQRLQSLEREKSPFDVGRPKRGIDVHYVEPRLVAEVAFGGWTQDGLLRQPRFQGLRPDKDRREVVRERPTA